MRRVNFLTALLMGALILFSPAGQACVEFARMTEGCRVAGMMEMASQHEAMGRAVGPAAPAAAKDACRGDGSPAADCCVVGTTSDQVEGLATDTSKVLVSLAAVDLRSAIEPALLDRDAAREHGPPVPCKNRYTLFSSYLL
ncbi:MAG: hypothetical protein GY769_22450 [bacterium]|nr:hypothetical protein [bacterium]